MLQYSNAISVTFLRGFSSVESYIAGSRMNDQGYATDLEISLFCNLFLCNVFVSSTIGWMKFAPTNSSGFYNLYVRIRDEHFDPILEVFPVLKQLEKTESNEDMRVYKETFDGTKKSTVELRSHET